MFIETPKTSDPMKQTGTKSIKTATLMVGTTLAFFYNLPFAMWNIRVDDCLLYVACILSIVSAIQYFNMNKEIIFPKKAAKK